MSGTSILVPADPTAPGGTPLLLGNGTAAAPSFSFLSNATSGLYHGAGANSIGLATNGTAALTIDSTQKSTFAAQIILGAGSAGTPSFALSEQTGMYLVGASIMGFTLAGTAICAISQSGNACTFSNKVGSSTSNGFIFSASNGAIAATVDASNGLIVRAGGICASTAGNNVNSGTLGWDGVSSSSGGLATAGGSTGLASAMTGATVTVGSTLIPAGCVVVGVSTRVTTLITSGAGTSFSIGDGTTANKFGSNIAFAAGTTTSIADWTATTLPVYAAATNIILTCNGGTFTAGAVRVLVHYIKVTAPSS